MTTSKQTEFEIFRQAALKAIQAMGDDFQKISWKWKNKKEFKKHD